MALTERKDIIMHDKKTVRLGIIGCGDISHAHANGARASLQDIEFVTCCDINEEIAHNWAKKYNCDRYYTDYLKMVKNENLDGIVICTWPNKHREQIEGCVNNGIKNILCEKSLTLTGKEAFEILTMAESNGVFVMEGFMNRHHQVIRKLESILLKKDEIGEIDSIKSVFSNYDQELESRGDISRNWRQIKEYGGGVPHDMTCYCVNLCNHFANSLPKKIYAVGGIGNYDTINRIFGMIEYENGRIGIIESSKKADVNLELEISCSYGTLYSPYSIAISMVENDEITIKHRHTKTPWISYLTDSYVVKNLNHHQLQLENFVEVIKKSAKPVLPLIESVVNIYTIESIVKSAMEERGAIDFKLPDGVKEKMII